MHTVFGTWAVGTFVLGMIKRWGNIETSLFPRTDHPHIYLYYVLKIYIPLPLFHVINLNAITKIIIIGYHQKKFLELYELFMYRIAPIDHCTFYRFNWEIISK